MSNIFGRIFGVFISLFPTRYIVLLLLLLSYVMFYNMIYTHRFVSFALRGIYFSSRKKTLTRPNVSGIDCFFPLSNRLTAHNSWILIHRTCDTIYKNNDSIYFQLEFIFSIIVRMVVCVRINTSTIDFACFAFYRDCCCWDALVLRQSANKWWRHNLFTELEEYLCVCVRPSTYIRTETLHDTHRIRDHSI